MLMIATDAARPDEETILEAAARAGRAIPPLWPLASSVAVNPFLGQTGDSLAEAAARLRRVAGIPMTMPRAWYGDRVASGEITEADLAAALDAAPKAHHPPTLAELTAAARTPAPAPRPLPTLADLAAEASGIDWPGLVAERIGHFAAAWFDRGQALWELPRAGGAYASWRAVAMHDLTPEIAGLTGFAAHVAEAPASASEAIAAIAERLDLTAAGLESYFHRLLVDLGGWAQSARYGLWQAELAGESDTTLRDCLAIRLVYEDALHRHYHQAVSPRWAEACATYAQPARPTRDDHVAAILQEAAERTAQRRLLATLDAGSPRASAGSRMTTANALVLQMAFCIDVRSEVFRRALESLDPGIRTLGFAGFFGLGIGHRPMASDVEEARLPVLLKPALRSVSSADDPALEARDRAARITARVRRALGRFKLAAISSFAFVEANGPVYVAKLLRDGLGLAPETQAHDPQPRFAPALDRKARVKTAKAVLGAMSLTDGFARLVIIAGHGANVVNNPHASALHCGACGGYSGEVNARLLAGLLNDRDVRQGLADEGIAIPSETLFLAALHDTTTDRVRLFAEDHSAPAHGADIRRAERWLADAALLARTERARRLPGAADAKGVLRRARDWAEQRPEWALAGCANFIAAPRARTAGLDLGGRAFLHDYDHRRDEGFAVLELILTAPVVVASWISLQYYSACVAPGLFGAGNKLLHNVTGGLGVVEGNGGVLRAGLPWQSVHDGEGFVHEPLRLSVLIAAPREAISAILDRHAGVRALFDNKWLHLFALSDESGTTWRYAGDLGWEKVAQDGADRDQDVVRMPG